MKAIQPKTYLKVLQFTIVLLCQVNCLQTLTKQLADKINWPETNYSGYVPVNVSGDKSSTDPDQIFYWWFPSRRSREKDPLILWLTGGPGCSGEMALFQENGPFKLNRSNFSLSENKYSWNNQANLLYVDQPIGVGYSTASSSDYVTTEDQVAKNLLEFLTGFLAKFPEFLGREFYVAGESYGGHFVPAIADYLNKVRYQFVDDPNAKFSLNLKGIMIGNGYINPWVQYEGHAKFALMNDLIGYEEYVTLLLGFRECETMMRFNIDGGQEKCETLYGQIVTNDKQASYDQIGYNTPNLKFNNYDITKPCLGPLCYDFGFLDTYMNKQAVKHSLGVKESKSWDLCNMNVGGEMAIKDLRTNMTPLLTDLLTSGVKVLLYHGELDMICNWVGGEMAANSIDWFGEVQFKATKFKNIGFGLLKNYANLFFIKFSDSGHMVPYDQPENALKMLTWFIEKQVNIY